MEIRRIKVVDVPDFLALWTRVYAEGAFLAKGPPAQSRVLQIVERVVRESIPNYVATDGGRLIGAVEVFPGSMCGMTGDGADRHGHLGIQVDTRYRGRGIGRELMMTAIADSGRYGFQTIELVVFESNAVATRLYEGLGFERTGYGDGVTLPSGVVTRAQNMVLTLDKTSRAAVPVTTAQYT